MMRSRFQHGLDELKERLLEMGGMAEAAIEMAAESYRKRDGRLAQQVFERERMINQSERTSTKWRWTCWRCSSPWQPICASCWRC
jgi:phosphate uptake regulator